MAKASGKPDRTEITPEQLYLNRREFIKNATLFIASASSVGGLLVAFSGGKRGGSRVAESPVRDSNAPELAFTRGPFQTNEMPTSLGDVTTYNNFYEFGTGKGDPSSNAHTLRPRPWSVSIEGEVERPEVIDVEKLLGQFSLEERIYRMRCVEAWSMVIPWIGVPLAEVLERVRPTSKASYVTFTTLHDTAQMPGQKRSVLNWPYVEGLRLDEAMHPLTLLAVGLYGKVLPNQNGAPIRLVVPWKYGFKGIKSIVKISLTADEPRTTWNEAAPDEYGFYANVNPEVDHPRWSQASERRIGEFTRRATLPFNGYEEEVAHLYTGMDLRRNF